MAMRTRYFYGWNVVAATFVMALFSFGLGFYGLTVYVAMLQRLHDWSASAVSAPITVYYVAGALLTALIGSVYERVGPRVVVVAGTIAMAGGVAALGVVTRAWHLYPAVLVMALGWGAMSGAAINVIVAPWFERRRGLAVSLAFNGATLGGIIVTPSVMYLVEVLGFARALVVAAVASIVIVGGVGIAMLRGGPELIGVGPDGDRVAPTRAAATAAVGPSLVGIVRDWTSGYAVALGACAMLQAIAAVLVLLGPGEPRPTTSESATDPRRARPA